MKQELVLKIQSEIKKRIDNGMSQNEIATKIGVSKATLSMLNNGKIDDISDEMVRKIAASLNINSTSEEWHIVKTENMAKIHMVCKEGKQYSRFLSITATSGQGKTTALTVFEQSNPNTYYVLCNVLMSQKSFLQKIAQSMGLTQIGNKEELLESIIKGLKSKEKPLLILDDAGKLKNDVYKILQLIYDECKANTGIIIAGVPFLETHITKLKERQKNCFPELYRRIGYWERLENVSDGMIRSIAKLYQINDVKALNFLCKYVDNLGTLSEWIINARRIANGEAITYDIILNASNHK